MRDVDGFQGRLHLKPFEKAASGQSAFQNSQPENSPEQYRHPALNDHMSRDKGKAEQSDKIGQAE